LSRVIEDNSIIIHIDECGAAAFVAANNKRLILGPQILNKKRSYSVAIQGVALVVENVFSF